MSTSGSDAPVNTILIVEDDASYLETISTQLREEGLNVVCAAGISEACALIEKQKFALVLLDWNLGGDGPVSEETSGRKVLDLCRKTSPLMPVIVMSGETILDVRKVSNEADSFLAKPFSTDLLVTHLTRWLKRQDALGQPAQLSRDEDSELMDLIFFKPDEPPAEAKE